MPSVKSYLSLIKFSHTIFAMPFALIGFTMAFFWSGLSLMVRGFEGPGWPSVAGGMITQPEASKMYDDPQRFLLIKLLLVILCMVFARSAAMAFNRYLDRSWDALNPRTAIREIPKGIIPPQHALAFTIINCILFITCTWFINRLCFFLAPVALAVVLGYSYTKRFTPLCHLILGVGLALAPIGAFIAVTGVFHYMPILLSFAVLFWVSGFDIIYALQDEEFDRNQKLKSIPAWLGKRKALRFSEVLHLLSALCVIAVGFFGGFGFLYWAGVLVFAGMLYYQHSLVKPEDLRKVNIAFMTANGIASVVFAVLVIADLFVRAWWH